MNVTEELRRCLLPVFGLGSIEQIREEAVLVKDLGADSLDFVEIVYLIERDFGVVLKANELVLAGVPMSEEDLFSEGKLTEKGASVLKLHFPDSNGRFIPGLTKMDLFQALTVRDLANIIKMRMDRKEA